MIYFPVAIMLSMTLIVALKSEGGIVLAGDKRAHTGNASLSYNDNNTKVFKLNDRVAIAGAGDGFDARLVIDELLKHPMVQTLDLDEIADLAYKISYEKQAALYKENEVLFKVGLKAPMKFGFLLVGFDKAGKSKIYSIMDSKLTPREITQNSCAIGVPLIAEYIFSKELKKNLTLNALADLAVKSIAETSNLVTAVSPSFDVIKISG